MTMAKVSVDDRSENDDDSHEDDDEDDDDDNFYGGNDGTDEIHFNNIDRKKNPNIVYSTHDIIVVLSGNLIPY